MIKEDAVSAAVASVLDRDVLSVESIAGSVTNQDFGVDLVDGRRVLVKIGPPAELTAEVWARGRVGAAGVQVPGVLGYEESSMALPVPFVILDWVRNDHSISTEALRAAGRAMAATHAIELAGYGPIEVTGDPLAPTSVAGRYVSWQAYIVTMLEDLDVLLGAGLLPADQCVRIRESSEDLQPSPLTGESGSLLHSDLKAQHILAERGRLAAIIDWGDASVGDPAWDLARASMMDDRSFATICGSYPGSDRIEVVRLLPIYRVLWNARTLAGEYRADGDWFAEYQRRIAVDLESW